METHAYNEAYLPYAMENIAVMMDCGINQCGFPAQLFHRMFLTSGDASPLENGNPSYLAGLSGAELASRILELTTGKAPAAIDGMYTNSSVSPLKKARENCGLTQRKLARISGISLRMIRAYEQKSQDISKASFATVSRLESVLHTKLGEC